MAKKIQPKSEFLFMNDLDGLYDCFKEHLMSLDIINESHCHFVSRVVDIYFNDLKSLGHISPSHEVELRDEIELEVIGMLRKTIYGHFDLDHFRKSKRSRVDYSS